METIVTAYGPYAFGLVSLMILWYTIVRPQVQIQSTQTEALQQTSETLKETALTNKEVTRELRGVVNDLRDYKEEVRWQMRHKQSTPTTGSTELL